MIAHQEEESNKCQEKGYTNELRVALNATQNITFSEEVRRKSRRASHAQKKETLRIYTVKLEA